MFVALDVIGAVLSTGVPGKKTLESRETRMKLLLFHFQQGESDKSSVISIMRGKELKNNNRISYNENEPQKTPNPHTPLIGMRRVCARSTQGAAETQFDDLPLSQPYRGSACPKSRDG